MRSRGEVSAIAGRPVAHHLFPNQVEDLQTGPEPDAPAGTELAARSSAPLVEDLRITDKVSQNLHAEMLLRAVARARRHIGSLQAGVEEMKAFLAEAGIDEDDYAFRRWLRPEPPQPGDAQGRGATAAVHVSPTPQWVSLLPVGGEDGTLSPRFGHGPAAGKIHAKTGTLSHVSALSGYAERRSRRRAHVLHPGEQLQYARAVRRSAR